MEGRRGDSFVEKWHPVYFIMPLFETVPKMPTLDQLLAALRTRFGRVETLAESPKIPTGASELLSVVLWDHMAYSKADEREFPSQLLLYGPDVFDRELWDAMTVANFWDCGPERQVFAERCRYSIMASNMMAAMLPGRDQYRIMAEYGDVLLELFPDCIALYFPHSRRLVPREQYLRSQWSDPELHFLDGGVHVRMFNISGSDEKLFDTLGLTAIGLPDLQVHCKGLDPNEVVGFLYNLAAYLYRCGDVIEDGNTVEGIDHDKWSCRREDAMAGPMRVVLDVCPGRFAGGGRSQEE